MILEISEHGSSLKRKHDCFIIKTLNDDVEIPAEKIDAIIITANALVSTQAIALCMEKEIQLVLASWSGQPFGRFWASTPGKATQIRRNQYLNQNSKIAFEISCEIVAIKLKGQKKLLIDLKNNRKSENQAILDAISGIGSMMKRLADLKFSNNFKETLLGIEGICAAKYFNAVSECLPKKYQFSERTRNPAQDEFNAVLNYGYGMAYSNVEKIIILSGLDPNAGFFHADNYGKPTLSFDLIEIARPRIDRIAVKMFTKRIARDSWFLHQNEGINKGVFLTKEGRKAIITEYVEKEASSVDKQTWQYCKKIVEKLSNGLEGNI